jgi:hypothetical protein
MALIALTMKNAAKVHFLYENSHLMNRDQRDFDKYWKYNNTIFDGRVFYHYKLSDFAEKAGILAENDLLIVDEADQFIFEKTLDFMKLIQDKRCICLTATPSNRKLISSSSRTNKAGGGDEDDIESCVLHMFDFQLMTAYNQERRHRDENCKYLVSTVDHFPKKEIVNLQADSQDFISYILSHLDKSAVLLYCDEKLKE